ncbi:hypothetical protein [Luteibacter sp. Lutesp34]|uniref:hypothetical protein n=1 Tax=Luteibacter sp. Lutesp34 TaxID=3243030 RepID=UPI0039B6CAF9
MNVQNWRLALALAALIGALIVHYLIYACRFMWYLDHPNFVVLVSAYLAFIGMMVVAFFVVPRWWIMVPLALLVMFAPPLLGVKYLMPIGPAFACVAVASSSLFVGVARLRSRR